MKKLLEKLVSISIFISFAVITSIMGAGFINYEKLRSAGDKESDAQSSLIKPNLPQPASEAETIFLTVSEIAKHNNSQSCWLLISGKVYDVTNSIESHPGGAKEILNYCGKEATQAFATRRGDGKHSSLASSMLADLYIGDLNQSMELGSNVINQAPAITSQRIKNIESEDEDEDD